MSQLILFLLLDQFADWETAYLSSALISFGHTVQTVSLDCSPIRSIGGFSLLPDHSLVSAPAKFDGLVLIGGNSWRSDAARQAEPLIHIAYAQECPLGAICDAAGFLGHMKLLNNHRHTCNDLADLRQWAGPRYSGEALFLPRQAVRDRFLVTANGTAPLEFAREFLLAMNAAPQADIGAWYQFHKLGFYTSAMPGM